LYKDIVEVVLEIFRRWRWWLGLEIFMEILMKSKPIEGDELKYNLFIDFNDIFLKVG
jgi:hypothetical protein